MLNQMRAGAGNIAAKILLVLLILSFALWGVEDMIVKSAHKGDVAEVGNTVITAANFSSQLAREKERVQMSLGANYSPELLKSFNLPTLVLDRMINRTLLKQETINLGISPSDADVAMYIAQNPNFADSSGRFSKQAFLDALRRNNLSENIFVEQTRQDMAMGIMMQSMASLPAVPDIAVRTIQASLDETRHASIYVLPLASVTPDEPTEEALTEYHTQHAKDFSIPEYRNVSYVTITDADVKKSIKINEDDLRKAYTEQAEDFKRPERRTVEQLLYSIENDAKKAADMLASGKSMAETAKTTDAINKKSLSLGNVEQDKVIAEAADAVFALKEGEYTSPIKSAFGWHIFHVSKIIPASIAPFEEVREQLKNNAEHIAADEALNKLSNQLIDTIASGVNIKQAASEVNLKAESLPAFDKSGKMQNGEKAKLPELEKFIETAFKVEDKSESGLTSSKGGVYYILHVDSIIPERVKPLEEVRKAVINSWKEQQRAIKAASLANTASEKMNDAKARDAAIAEFKLQLTSTEAIKRDTISDKLPGSLVSEIFDRKPGDSTGAHVNNNGDYVIAVVKDIVKAPTAEKEEATMAKLRETMSDAMTDELTQQYMAYLKRQHTVTINETVFKQFSAHDSNN